MAADIFSHDAPQSVIRSTVSSSTNTYRQLTIPTWALTVTIESEAGGSDLFVAPVGSDEGALGAHYCTVVTGAGPREFTVGKRGRDRLSALYIASATGGAAYVAEAEAASR